MTYVGIDLGTTNSCIAVSHDNHVVVLKNKGRETTPSKVGYEGKECKVGVETESIAIKSPSQVISNAKRFIGMEFTHNDVQNVIEKVQFDVYENPTNRQCEFEVKVDGHNKRIKPEQVSAEVLRKLYDLVPNKEKVAGVCITIPANFNVMQRRATMLAAKIARLPNVMLIHEPTAAAISYGFSNPDDDKCVLIYDFGGGTLDVTILEIESDAEDESGYNILTTQGDPYLGGEDFDQKLVKYAADKLKADHGIDLSKDKKGKENLKKKCEKAKVDLSLVEKTTIDFTYGSDDFEIPINRKLFKSLCADLIERCHNPIDEALREAKKKPEDIDTVILVGGSSRMEMIQEMLKKYFAGVDVLAKVNPDLEVAKGAAIYQEIINSGGINIINDVIPFDIGTKVDLPIGTIIPEGCPMCDFDPIIRSGTHFPCEVRKKYYTNSTNQSFMINEIREGKGLDASKTILLDKFNIYGIPPGPAGTCYVEDCYTIDKNGILTVTSTVCKNGNQVKAEIKKESYMYNEAEINRMMGESDAYKAIEEEEEEKTSKKSELQEYILAQRRKLKGAKRREVSDIYNDTEEWLDTDHTLAQINAKFEEVKSIIERIKSE